jgi:hypothetical protein
MALAAYPPVLCKPNRFNKNGLIGRDKQIFNSAAFTAPPAGQQGEFGRNVLWGFGAWQADVGLQRQFHLTEKVGASFLIPVLQL